MKTMNFMKGMAFAAVMVMSMNIMAQRVNNNNRRNRGELVVSEHGINMNGANDRNRMDRRYPRMDDRRDPRMDDRRAPRMDDRRDPRMDDRRDPRMDDRRDPRMDDRRDPRGHVEVYGGRGHVIPPHYADRVRHMDDGRWGYLRGNRWYYYDTYFEPDYYFAHPVAHFHSHRLGSVGKAIVATAAVATLISILAN